ncbi:type VI secretion system tube protein Hcp [Pseudoduganella sp. SL102]|uniref:Hcp family type VI secretion system effector n=1 Tax=Pseudoduganella sp. SL102 TaxID=2995154 RepID=UPI00248B2255|nr:type VI secretion system tube protein Hcp [Pseudoduganella sp. SL102]WBS00037.1 type VI secretion system tube protein Hcp [Pseudoduganella sp. SL102]
MPMHSYLRIDGVAGGSTDSGYEGWIACDSVSWSLHGAGSPEGLSEIRFVKPEDAASPVLARLCVTAASVARARFDFLRVAPDGSLVKCYEIEVEDVTVGYVATGPRREEALMETVVLTFRHARLTSSPRDGQPGGPA